MIEALHKVSNSKACSLKKSDIFVGSTICTVDSLKAEMENSGAF